MLQAREESLMRPYNLQIQKRNDNGISISKMLRKSVEHDFTHLKSSSWKFSFVKQK